MFGDEFFVSIVSVTIAAWAWFSWYSDLVRVTRLGEHGRSRQILAMAPPLSLVFLYFVLVRYAAKEVREDSVYILMYLVLGAAWIGLVTKIAGWLGISVRDDVLEHRNCVALWPCLAAVVGATITFAGSNVGEGPGVEAVLASAGLATGLWLVLWRAYEQFTSASEKITIEHDTAAALKLGAVLLGNSIVLGVAASGDWIPRLVLTGFFRIAIFAIAATFAAIIIDGKSEGRWPGFLYLSVGIGVFVLNWMGRL